ncbi:hypothetical protein MUA04_14195 [Enterobacteriaceae bacterium H11S18]|uniref:hypothetical protein n=1 Tax=Dryocola clanedunensis TaxID=2925396 RepID=UPI0022F12BED|nr:hypothetical protein [Dryocola clanedunensis]MCT4711331.1 hypothetical protein [Dryocola clanedunensis]
MKVKIVRMLVSAVTMTVAGSVIGYGYYAYSSPLDRGFVLVFAGYALAVGLYVLCMFPDDGE